MLLSDETLGNHLCLMFRTAKELYDQEQENARAEGREMRHINLRLLTRDEVEEQGVQVPRDIHDHRFTGTTNFKQIALVK
jgi:hypothetical protein